MVRWPGKVEAGSVCDNILSLNDTFATIAELMDSELPAHSAEDSFSFLSILQERSDEPHRDHVICHSVGGEFAYIQGPWKLVYRNAFPNREQSRGLPRVVELYHLANDIAESNDLAGEHPDVVKQLEERLESIIEKGASRKGSVGRNDTEVNIEVTQTLRWAPPVPSQ